jgi:hypothetical protein
VEQTLIRGIAMQGHKDEWIRDRVKWRLTDYFTKSSSEVLFFEGGSYADSTLRRIATLRSVGLPIMAFWRSEELWTLLGSEKIVWQRGSQVGELPLDELRWVTEHGMWDALLNAPSADPGPIKINRETLRLTSRSGDDHLVWTAPSGWCIAFWNVLLMLIGMQKIATHPIR